MLTDEDIQRLIEGETLEKGIEDLTADPAFAALRKRYKANAPGGVTLRISRIINGQIAEGVLHCRHEGRSGGSLRFSTTFKVETSRASPFRELGGGMCVAFNRFRWVRTSGLKSPGREALGYENYFVAKNFPGDLVQLIYTIAEAVLAKEKQNGETNA